MNSLLFCGCRWILRRIDSAAAVKAFTTALLLLCFSVLSGTAASQSVIHVPKDFPTIQAAINAAVNGDTVLVVPGVYVENINFMGKGITVASSGGANVTVIDGNSAGSVVDFVSGESGSAKLRGFTIRNGYDLGGIRIDSASPVITENIVVNNRSRGNAPGIAVWGGSPLIQRNLISGNIDLLDDQLSGAILVSVHGSPQILGNVIAGNTTGGFSLFAGTPLVQGNVVSGNSTARKGGGIRLRAQSDAVIMQNLIIGNRAGEGGGGIWWLVSPGDQPLVVSNTIADNDAPAGSGVWADGSDAQARMLNNIIVSKPGQMALYCGAFEDPSPPIIQFNDVYAPSGIAYGGLCSSGIPNAGNISANPLFLDPVRGDYRLSSGSPAIDTGSNSVAPLPSSDFDLKPRISDGDGNGVATVDMGAYEFASSSPSLSVSSTANDLGTFIKGSLPVEQTVTIANEGTGSRTVILSAAATNEPAAFDLTAGGPAPCASLAPVLAAGSSCTLVVTFTPTSPGSKNALVVVMSDGALAMTPLSATVQAVDAAPDPFSFVAQNDVARAIAVTSNSVTVAGMNVPTGISIAGGEYSINGGAFTSNPGTVVSGQNVVVRLTSSASYLTTVTAWLTIGTASAGFSVTTLAVDTTPDAVSFVAQNDVARAIAVTSNSVTVAGVNVPTGISITGGEYSINGGAFTSNPGTVVSGQNVVVRLTSSASYLTTVTAWLTIGTASAGFSVTTQAQTISNNFPLTPGNSWVTRTNGGPDNVTTVTGPYFVNGAATLALLDGSDGSIEYMTNDALGLRSHRIYVPTSAVPGCSMVAETDTFSPPVTILPASGSVGQTVNSSGSLLVDLGVCGSFTLPYAATATLLAVEQVSVPAGQFDAIKVLLTVSLGTAGSIGGTLWFAPGVGQVKGLTFDGIVDELVSTSIVRTVPDFFVFAPQSNVAVNSSVISNAATIAGITVPAGVSIAGGEYSINGGAFTNQPGSVTNGQNIRVRLTSSAQGSASTTATLTVGGVARTFSVTTGASAPSAPTSVSATSSVGSIILKFVPPASDGGAAVTAYTATCTSSNGGQPGSSTVNAATTSIRVDGLTTARAYTCAISASNALGIGQASVPSNVATPFDISPILNLLLLD